MLPAGGPGVRRARPGRRKTSATPFLRRGYTLVKLVLTLIIVALLAAIGVVSYQAYRERIDVAKAGSDIAPIADLYSMGKDGSNVPPQTAAISRDDIIAGFVRTAAGGAQGGVATAARVAVA